MKILLIGSGGREHAIAWKLKQSPLVEELYCAPAGAAIGRIATPAPVDINNHASVAEFCDENGIDLVFVGPEAPLAAGITDMLHGCEIKVFGPTAKGALLESSKSYAKEFMRRYHIPTASYAVCTSPEDAKKKIMEFPEPLVVKADGLASGKGVRVCATRDEAFEALDEMMVDRIFGEAGSRVVIEECLAGREVSALAFCDGKTCLALPPSRDHKRLMDGDIGPNTGGMGAIAPVADVTPEITAQIKSLVFDRFLDGIKGEQIDYRGVIYAGLMLTKDGPKVIEFNCRFGDPETQALMPLLQSDLADTAMACAQGDLGGRTLKIAPGTCACVVLASRGYPLSPKSGQWITGLDANGGHPGGLVFHAGTKHNPQHGWETSGGRVLALSCNGPTLKDALNAVYSVADEISFDGIHYRRDIGRIL
jgi:phosphoribosylamine--glycine ligase